MKKPLTEAQVAALRAAAENESAWRAARDVYGRHRRTAGRSATRTVGVLYERGFITFSHAYIPARSEITPAGRAALFEATGEHLGGSPIRTSPGTCKVTIVAVYMDEQAVRTLVRDATGAEMVLTSRVSP